MIPIYILLGIFFASNLLAWYSCFRVLRINKALINLSQELLNKEELNERRYRAI